MPKSVLEEIVWEHRKSEEDLVEISVKQKLNIQKEILCFHEDIRKKKLGNSKTDFGKKIQTNSLKKNMG